MIIHENINLLDSKEKSTNSQDKWPKEKKKKHKIVGETDEPKFEKWSSWNFFLTQIILLNWHWKQIGMFW